MRTMRFAACVTALAIAPAALSACGGGDDNSADEDQITQAIDQSATSGDAAACRKYQTQKFVEQNSGGATGEEAFKQCEQDAADSVADSVDVNNIEVDGDKATADVAVTGSFFDGQTLAIALVKDGDQWKLDQFTDFAEFNRDAFVKAALAEIAKDPSTPKSAVACLQKQFNSVSDEELKAAFIGTDQSAGDKLFGPCFQGGG